MAHAVKNKIKAGQKAPQLSICSFYYNKGSIRPSYLHRNIMAQPHHHLKPVLLQYYREIDLTKFRTFIELNTLKLRPARKNEVGKQLRRAFRRACEARGIDRNGETISDGTQKLSGQLVIYPNPKTINATKESIAEDMSKILDTITKPHRVGEMRKDGKQPSRKGPQ